METFSQSQQSTQSQAVKAKDVLRFCRYCPFSTRKRPELEEHMESDHERCTICKRAFKGGEELMKHIQEDHNRTKCPKCEKMIAANLMDRHSEEHITRERISKVKKVKKPLTAGAKKGKIPMLSFVVKNDPKSNSRYAIFLPQSLLHHSTWKKCFPQKNLNPSLLPPTTMVSLTRRGGRNHLRETGSLTHKELIQKSI